MAGMGPNAGSWEIDGPCMAAAAAFEPWSRSSPDFRGCVLESIASALDARRDEILRTTADETALTIEELTPEFARMTGTLRMFAALVREGSWVRAAIDRRYEPSARAEDGRADAPKRTAPGSAPSARAEGSYQPIGPNHDIRRMLVPLGPVAVFGSSNFPLAYGVCGGDTASALAAGCPVVVKEHPAHPRTGRLLAAIAQDASERAGVKEHLLGYVHNEDAPDFTAARDLVRDPRICAVGFTGSIPGGLEIERLGRARPVPIPVFAEMGSNNVIVITASAAAERAEKIAEELATSILQRFGQQCTCPGTITVEPGDAGDCLVQALGDRIAASPGREMLAPWIKTAYERRLERLEGSSIVRLIARGTAGPGDRGSFACLMSAQLSGPDTRGTFERATLRDEVFGPAAVVVRMPIEQVGSLGLRASLTWSVYAEDAEAEKALCSLELGRGMSGRIIFNGVPTGVRVAHGMVHGGPYPATNRPDTTAVGPYAIERWCRPVCWQNCPDSLLPAELQNANPRGIWRMVNGERSRGPTL